MNPVRGILLKLLSIVLFMGMITCVKILAARMPPGEVVFARSAFGLLPIIAYLVVTGKFAAALHTNRPLGHVGRGIAGVVSMVFWFMALGLLPLPEAMAITYAAPLMTVVFAVIFLGERVRIFRWSATIIGFIGILIILYPRLGGASIDEGSTLGAWAALASAILAAAAIIQARRLVATERTPAIVFYFSLCASVFALFTLPFGWVMPTGEDLWLMVLSGILGGLGQILLTEAYRYADASTIAPFEYSSMILGLFVGYVFFAEAPTVWVLTGAAIVIAAGIFIIYREHALGLERARARKVVPPHG